VVAKWLLKCSQGFSDEAQGSRGIQAMGELSPFGRGSFAAKRTAVGRERMRSFDSQPATNGHFRIKKRIDERAAAECGLLWLGRGRAEVRNEVVARRAGGHWTSLRDDSVLVGPWHAGKQGLALFEGGGADCGAKSVIIPEAAYAARIKIRGWITL